MTVVILRQRLHLLHVRVAACDHTLRRRLHSRLSGGLPPRAALRRRPKFRGGALDSAPFWHGGAARRQRYYHSLAAIPAQLTGVQPMSSEQPVRRLP